MIFSFSVHSFFGFSNGKKLPFPVNPVILFSVHFLFIFYFLSTQNKKKENFLTKQKHTKAKALTTSCLMDPAIPSPLSASMESSSPSAAISATSLSPPPLSRDPPSFSTRKLKHPLASTESIVLSAARIASETQTSAVSVLEEALSQERDLLQRARITADELSASLSLPLLAQEASSATPMTVIAPSVPQPKSSTSLIPSQSILTGAEMNPKVRSLSSRPKSQLSKLDRTLLKDSTLLPSQRREKDLKGVPPVSSLLQSTCQSSRSSQLSMRSSQEASSSPRLIHSPSSTTGASTSPICLSDSEEDASFPPILEEVHFDPSDFLKDAIPEREDPAVRSSTAAAIRSQSLTRSRSPSRSALTVPSASVSDVLPSTTTKISSKSTSRKPSSRATSRGAKRASSRGSTSSEEPPAKRGCAAFFSHEPTGLRAWFYDGSDDLVTRFLRHTLERHPH